MLGTWTTYQTIKGRTVQTRVTEEFKFDPHGPEVSGRVDMEYDLVKVTQHQARRTDRELWRLDTSVSQAYTREVVGTLTRSQVAKLIADGADWLALANGAS